MAEILNQCGIEADYATLAEEERIALIGREIASKRPLTALLDFSEETNETIRLFRLVRRAQRTLGEAAVQTYIISMTTEISHVLEVTLLARRCRPLRQDRCDAPVRDGGRPAARPDDHGTALRKRGVSQASRRARRPPADHDRLQRLEQGRRLSDGQLDALPCAEQAGRRMRRARREAAPVPRTRRHAGQRRRPGQPRDPGATHRVDPRAHQDHRTGRGDQQPLLQPRDCAPSSGAVGQRRAADARRTHASSRRDPVVRYDG